MIEGGHSGCAATGAPGCCAFSFISSVSLKASWTMHTPGQSSISRPNLRLRYPPRRSEEHTSELQSLMRISYAVFCLKKKKQLTHRRYTAPYKQQINYIY